MKNELRIGNLVNYKDKPRVVYQIRNSGCDFHIAGNDFHSYIWDAIKPIPLTEELLLKFGFVKKSWLTKGIVIESTYFQLNNFIVYLLNDSFEIELINKSGEQFNLYKNWDKEVHKLQNIYFDIEGEELITK